MLIYKLRFKENAGSILLLIISNAELRQWYFEYTASRALWASINNINLIIHLEISVNPRTRENIPAVVYWKRNFQCIGRKLTWTKCV